MAFVSNDDEEEQKNGVSPNGGGAVHLAPSSGVGSVAPNSSGGGNVPKDAGGSFASLDKYVTANQGQAQPLAGKITGSINNQYNTLDQGNQSTLQGINSQVSGAYTPNDPNVIAQASANPVSFAGDQNNVKAFQSLLNDTYGGPASAQSTNGFQTQQAKVNNAIAQGNTQTTTAAGRTQLVGQNSAKPTQSVTALNSAILSRDPNALGQVQDAYKPFGNLVSGLNSGAEDTNKQIAKAQADVQAANKGAQGVITGQTQGLNTGVQSNLDAANAANQKTVGLYNGLVDTFSHGANALSAEQADALGLTPEQAQTLARQGELANTSQYMTGHNFGAASDTTDINNNAFLSQFAAPVDPTASQVATPEQFATLKALFALNNGQTPTGSLIDPANAAQAGTYVAPTLKGSFNYDQALANATGIQQQERAAAQEQANALTAQADAAHYASKHSGVLGSVRDAVTHPGTLAAMVANPLSYGANAARILQGRSINPKDISAPAAKVVAPVAGAVIGGIYGGGAGAVAGGAAGQALGGTLQTLGGQSNKNYAEGGFVEAAPKEPEARFKKLIGNFSKGAK